MSDGNYIAFMVNGDTQAVLDFISSLPRADIWNRLDE